MKTFTDFNQVGQWITKVIDKTNEKAKEMIAREVYVDSRKYIFYDTGKMYQSGEQSPFKKGIVIITAPQVRRLYYTNWAKNPTNPNSRIQWYEPTKKENMNKYLKMYADLFSEEVSK